jgi:Phosphodiester glycosidase
MHAASAVLASLFAIPGHAQSDTIARRELAPGVSFVQFIDRRIPLAAYLVRVDLHRAGVELRVLRARDQLRGREQVTDMVRRAQAAGADVLAAVNGDFFELKSGENENNQVIGGEWWKGLKVTDSPYDTYDNVHVQFGVDVDGQLMMDRFLFDGRAIAHGAQTPIITLNLNPSGNPEGTALYTSRFGATTPRDTTRPTVEVPLVAAGRHGDTLLYLRRGAVSSTSGSEIPVNGAVLAAYGPGTRASEVRAMTDGDTIKLVLSTLPRPLHGMSPSLLVGGWPRIMRDGAIVAGEAPVVEGTISRNAEARHPRTAIGFSRDSSTLFVLAVDGRSARSAGVTLVELATLMRNLGAWNAMNFDGGGSTTMVVGGAIVNAPTDAAGEREVGNALAIVRKR